MEKIAAQDARTSDETCRHCGASTPAASFCELCGRELGTSARAQRRDVPYELQRAQQELPALRGAVRRAQLCYGFHAVFALLMLATLAPREFAAWPLLRWLLFVMVLIAARGAYGLTRQPLLFGVVLALLSTLNPIAYALRIGDALGTIAQLPVALIAWLLVPSLARWQALRARFPQLARRAFLWARRPSAGAEGEAAENGCRACGAALSRDPKARFCATCGTPTAAGRREVLVRGRLGAKTTQRAVLVFASVFLAMLMALVLAHGRDQVVFPAEVLVCIAAQCILGLASWRATVGGLGTRYGWLTALPLAALALVSTDLVLTRLLGVHRGDGTRPEELLPFLASYALLPGLLEELVCRGVVWHAATLITSTRGAILLSALVFAFLHGLGTDWLFELPTRLLLGIVLGWLRSASHSLLPGIVLHAAHNTLVLLVAF